MGAVQATGHALAMAKRNSLQGLISTRRRTKLDDGHVQFLHVLEDPALGLRRSSLSFRPETGALVLEESRAATGRTVIAFDLSPEELDTLAEVLSVWRVKRVATLRSEPVV
jgi:hypothetical protein